jgi:hypothetical protein
MAAGTIKVIVFPGDFNLSLWTAIDRQFFKSYGIEIEPHYTTSSVEQLSGLILGRWEARARNPRIEIYPSLPPRKRNIRFWHFADTRTQPSSGR